jgi:hypothetical protein
LTTIPGSLYVNVLPSVLPASGTQLDVVTLVGSASNRVPIGSVYSFSAGVAVTNFFGAGSPEDIVANGGVGKGSGYFGGFTGADSVPGAILYAQYNQAAVAAYVWGGNAGAALTLAQLQALTGSLTVVMDGYSHVIASISFAGDSSFSAVAAAISAAFTDPTEASFTAAIGATATGAGSGTNLTLSAVTGLVSIGDSVAGTGVPAATTILSQTSGTTGGAGVYVTNNATTIAGAAVISSNVLNVTVDTDHAIAAGQTVTGASVAAGTLITAQIGGTAGGVGTYRISGNPQEVVSEAMTGVATAPVVTFDSLSGAFVITSGITGAPSTAAFPTGTLAAPLLLTSATSAVLSQGAAGQTPAQFMNSVVAVTQNFVCYKTTFDPDNGSGNTLKLAFAAWKNSYQANRFAYVVGDTDPLAVANPPQAETMGAVLAANGDSGTFLITETGTGQNIGSFVCGAAAAIDFEETNGRITFAYKSQPGLVASITTETAAVNAGGNPQSQGGSFGNGYNYYGAVSTANQNFQFLQRGVVTGPFKWFDSYINQIWWNNLLQNTLLVFLTTVKSIPFSPVGAGMIEQALATPIAAGLNFGAAAPGQISSTQIAEVNNQAGANIAPTLQAQGYYLQVLQQSSIVRGNRGPWTITLWFLDRGAVQSIALASVAVQ